MSSVAKSRSSSSFSDWFIIFLLVSRRLSITSCSSWLLAQKATQRFRPKKSQSRCWIHVMCEDLTLLSCACCTAIRSWRIYQALLELFARSQSSFGFSSASPFLSYGEQKKQSQELQAVSARTGNINYWQKIHCLSVYCTESEHAADRWAAPWGKACWRCPPRWLSADWESPHVRKGRSSPAGSPGVWLWSSHRFPRSSGGRALSELLNSHKTIQ